MQVAKQQAILAGLVAPLTSALSSQNSEVRRLSSQALTALAQVLTGRMAMARAGTLPALAAAACSGTEAAVATLEVGVLTKVRLAESAARAHGDADAGMIFEKRLDIQAGPRTVPSPPAAAHQMLATRGVMQLLGQYVGALDPLCQ